METKQMNTDTITVEMTKLISRIDSDGNYHYRDAFCAKCSIRGGVRLFYDDSNYGNYWPAVVCRYCRLARRPTNLIMRVHFLGASFGLN